jgi:hypothetical protein
MWASFPVWAIPPSLPPSLPPSPSFSLPPPTPPNRPCECVLTVCTCDSLARQRRGIETATAKLISAKSLDAQDLWSLTHTARPVSATAGGADGEFLSFKSSDEEEGGGEADVRKEEDAGSDAEVEEHEDSATMLDAGNSSAQDEESGHAARGEEGGQEFQDRVMVKKRKVGA